MPSSHGRLQLECQPTVWRHAESGAAEPSGDAQVGFANASTLATTGPLRSPIRASRYSRSIGYINVLFAFWEAAGKRESLQGLA